MWLAQFIYVIMYSDCWTLPGHLIADCHGKPHTCRAARLRALTAWRCWRAWAALKASAVSQLRKPQLLMTAATPSCTLCSAHVMILGCCIWVQTRKLVLAGYCACHSGGSTIQTAAAT